MKKIIIVFLALFLVVPLVAQKGDNYQQDFKRGYKLNIELGDQFYRTQVRYQGNYFNLQVWKLNIINSYQVNPYFSAGIGTGLWFDFYEYNSYTGHADWYWKKDPMVPVFINLKANLNDNKISPYLSIDAGMFNLRTPYFFICPELGASIKLSNTFVFNLGFGFPFLASDLTFASG